MQGALLKTCFDIVVESATVFGLVCWGSSISAGDRDLIKQIKKASSVLGCPLSTVEVVRETRRMANEEDDNLTAQTSSFSHRLFHFMCKGVEPVQL